MKPKRNFSHVIFDMDGLLIGKNALLAPMAASSQKALGLGGQKNVDHILFTTSKHLFTNREANFFRRGTSMTNFRLRRGILEIIGLHHKK